MVDVFAESQRAQRCQSGASVLENRRNEGREVEGRGGEGSRWPRSVGQRIDWGEGRRGGPKCGLLQVIEKAKTQFLGVSPYRCYLTGTRRVEAPGPYSCVIIPTRSHMLKISLVD